jgi:prolyl oligopeptidase
MKTYALLSALLLVGPATGVPPPPATERDEVRETLHGVEVVDPYRWLEDQESPKTRAWIDAQSRYTRSVLATVPGRERLEQRLGELLRVETYGFPTERGGRYFFMKRAADQDLSVLHVRAGEKGPDEVLLDPHAWSPDHTTSIALLDVSEDGSRVVYGIRKGGEDELTVKVLDVAARKDLPDTLPRARYSGVSLTPDGKVLYYSRREKEGPRVFRHVLGEGAAADTKVFGDGYGPEKLITAGISDDGRWLTMTVLHGSAPRQTEVYYQDLRAPGPVRTLVNDVEAWFYPEVSPGRLYLRTNWNAPRGRVLAVDLERPAREQWKEVVAQGRGVIQGLSLAGGKLFVRTLEDVRSRVRIHGADGAPAGEIAFPALGTVSSVQGRWASPTAFFSFTSYHVAPAIHRYDVRTGSRSDWAVPKVPFDSGRYEVRQEWYPSKDGTRVPMFLVHRKGLPRPGDHPTLLTGYGGFTQSQTPAFSPKAAAWVEAGGVYALPNLRGGGEFGEEWHRAGMLDKKQNVFDDFVAAGEWLVKNGYTSPARLAISGGSNGGLLVGAAMTQRPDLFAAVVCSYPLLDMVRYHQFLVAGYWVPEYGSAADPRQFPYLHAYSPYHRVKAGVPYPAVLFITGDSDTRVAPLHARKMAALMQSSNGSGKPVLLQYDTRAGHSSGGKPVALAIEDLRDELSFLFWQLGVGAS